MLFAEAQEVPEVPRSQGVLTNQPPPCEGYIVSGLFLDGESQGCSYRDTGKVRDYLKRMDIKLEGHCFTDEDPIRELDFLARLVREENIQGMSKALDLIAIPNCLTRFSRSKYEAGSR